MSVHPAPSENLQTISYKEYAKRIALISCVYDNVNGWPEESRFAYLFLDYLFKILDKRIERGQKLRKLGELG